jgi:acyl dehydratase
MLTYEDFTEGRIFDFPPYLVTAEEIKEFASEFDPQPFHLDEASEQAKQVGGLIASGWHTSAIQMRMICDGYLLNSTSQGSPGLDQVRWLNVVRPGDTLTGSAEVVGRRVSKSRPSLGIVSFVYTMTNQRGEDVMVTKGVGLFSLKTEEIA